MPKRLGRHTKRDWWHHFDSLSLPNDHPRKITHEQFPVVMLFVRAAQRRMKERFSCGEVGQMTGVSQSHAKHVLYGMRRRGMVRSIGKNGVESLYELTPPAKWSSIADTPHKSRRPMRTFRTRKSESGFELHIPGRGIAVIPSAPEIRIVAGANEAVSIVGAEASSLRVPADATFSISPGLKIAQVPNERENRPGLKTAQVPSPVGSHGSQTSANDAGPGLKTAQAPTLPDWVPIETWGEYLRMREAIRRPLVPAGVSLILRDLAELRAQGQDVRAVLEQSIAGGHVKVWAVRRASRRSREDGARGAQASSGAAQEFCWKCGRTKAYHGRPLANIQREDPKWTPHEFARNPGTAA